MLPIGSAACSGGGAGVGGGVGGGAGSGGGAATGCAACSGSGTSQGEPPNGASVAGAAPQSTLSAVGEAGGGDAAGGGDVGGGDAGGAPQSAASGADGVVAGVSLHSAPEDCDGGGVADETSPNPQEMFSSDRSAGPERLGGWLRAVKSRRSIASAGLSTLPHGSLPMLVPPLSGMGPGPSGPASTPLNSAITM